MIERNYSRYIDQHGADAALRAVMPDFEPAEGVVVPLHGVSS
jgi:hypothetical protein